MTRRVTRWVVSGLLAMVVGGMLTLVGGPRSPQLGPDRSGDPALASDVGAALADDDGLSTVSAGRVRDGQVTFAGLGSAHGATVTAETPFELGSITKTMTGELLAIGLQRRELGLTDKVETHLPELAGSAVGSATLEQLVTHTAGLPPFPDALAPQVVVGVLTNQNTYDGSVAALLAGARTTKVTERGDYRYSNLGMALLGHAEARAAGVPDWPTLARARLLEPLGMTRTTFALSAADVPDGAAPPRHANGWPAANWYGPAFAPAGSSTWTTGSDLARYATALLDGTAPGASALDPRQPIPRGQIGLAWHLRDVDGRTITWHNGGTGGFRTMLALDRDRGQAVWLLTNSTRDVDAAALRLAATAPGAPVPAVDAYAPSWLSLLGVAVAGLALLGSFAAGLLRGGDRLRVLTATVSGVTGLLLLLVHGPWDLAPAWLWGALSGGSAVVAVAGLRRLPTLSTWPSRRRALGVVSLVVGLLVLAGVLATT